MADTKITGLLSPQVTTNPATDVLPIVNIADTSMASSGSTRKITVNTLLGAGGTATLASATITGALDAARLNVTAATIPANGVYLVTTNKIGFSTNSIQRLNIDATGNLTNSTTLTGNGFLLFNNSIDGGDLGYVGNAKALMSGGAVSSLGLRGESSIQFSIAANLGMTFNSTGLGVGVSSPTFNIHARGTTDGRIQVEGASGYGMVFIQASSGNSAQLQLNSNGGSGRRYVVASNTSGQFLIGDETAVATRLTIDSSGNLISNVTGTAPTLAANSQMVFNLTSNTNLRISVRGTDGTTRTANITLA